MAELQKQLIEHGLSAAEAEKIGHYLKTLSPEQCWKKITAEILIPKKLPFYVHQLLYKTIYPEWDKIPSPAWFPEENAIKKTHLATLMRELDFENNYKKFHQWSVQHYADFWEKMVKLLDIKFNKPYTKIVDLSEGIESPQWFPGTKLNIANSCFNASGSDIAIVEQNEQGIVRKINYADLNKLSNRIANSLLRYLKKGDKIAIIMPMTIEAVAIYLGTVKAGLCVVSIADSFSVDEIVTRLRIADVKAVFTQDYILRDNKSLPLYKKIIAAHSGLTVVLPAEKKLAQPLRDQDVNWDTFLSNDDNFTPVACDPNAYTNILFSSGTTGDPKAIPWTHTTPIKCASDAYLHSDIHPGNILCWPTSLGWMMGPWLIYASLINHATIALYNGMPNGKGFGKFIQDAKVTFLGVVPTLVKTWRSTGCMENVDWNAIKLFSSTGECSNIDDMLYLMSLANYKPIIEYCGGTEIGGAYIAGTMIHPAAPAAFTTPTLGLDFTIIDEEGAETNNGEVAIIPPSIGLSNELINKDHHHVYYENMPKSPRGQILRRHGDEVEQYSNGYFRLHGRTDDTMNLGGIKVSSAEIEAVLNILPEVYETAAVAENPPGGGPSQLIIYVVLKQKEKTNLEKLKIDMQNAIKQHLNPLFKIHEVVTMDILPRTASNKMMRRKLRH